QAHPPLSPTAQSPPFGRALRAPHASFNTLQKETMSEGQTVEDLQFLREVSHRMSLGIPVLDRKYGMTIHRMTFLSEDAIAWMMADPYTKVDTVRAAMELGQSLMNEGFIQRKAKKRVNTSSHFSKEKPVREFKGGKRMYCFNKVKTSMLQLHVVIKGARNVQEEDTFFTSDPYCIAQLGSQRQETRVEPGTSNPTWNQHFVFGVDAVASEQLILTVMDYDKLKYDAFRGKLQLSLLTLRIREGSEDSSSTAAVNSASPPCSPDGSGAGKGSQFQWYPLRHQRAETKSHVKESSTPRGSVPSLSRSLNVAARISRARSPTDKDRPAPCSPTSPAGTEDGLSSNPPTPGKSPAKSSPLANYTSSTANPGSPGAFGRKHFASAEDLVPLPLDESGLFSDDEAMPAGPQDVQEYADHGEICLDAWLVSFDRSCLEEESRGMQKVNLYCRVLELTGVTAAEERNIGKTIYAIQKQYNRICVMVGENVVKSHLLVKDRQLRTHLKTDGNGMLLDKLTASCIPRSDVVKLVVNQVRGKELEKRVASVSLPLASIPFIDEGDPEPVARVVTLTAFASGVTRKLRANGEIHCVIWMTHASGGQLLEEEVPEDAEETDDPPVTLPEPLAFVHIDNTQLSIGYNRLVKALTDSSSKLMAAFYEARGYTEVSITPWTRGGVEANGMELSGCSRQVEFLIPKSMMVPANHARESQKITTCCSTGLIMEWRTSTPELPFGSTFHTMTRLCLQRTGPNKCGLHVSAGVRYTGSRPFAAKQIENGIQLGTKEAYELLLELITCAARGKQRPSRLPKDAREDLGERLLRLFLAAAPYMVTLA
ncbi:unnamed protein product, partial [Chrysoparadoxa australica]